MRTYATARWVIVWLMFGLGVVAEVGGTYLLFTEKISFWGIIFGWPMGVLMAWLITRVRKLESEATGDIMKRGLLAIFYAPLARYEEAETGDQATKSDDGSHPDARLNS